MAEQKRETPKGFSKLPSSTAEKTTTDITTPDVSSLMAKLDGKIKVIHGANDEVCEVVGKQVSQVRESLKDSFNIPNDAVVYVDGKEVGNDYVLKSGQVLEFIRASGVKGVSPYIPMTYVN